MARNLILLAITMLAAAQVYADDEGEAKTVIGPRNVYLYDGANELMAGNPTEGVRLTLKGLELAHGLHEKKVAHTNLCAGFMLLGQAETALEHCDWVLERDPYNWRTYNNRAIVYLRLGRFEEAEADIKKGLELNPSSETLKEVKGMYLDEVEPVDEEITIDERRSKPRSSPEMP